MFPLNTKDQDGLFPRKANGGLDPRAGGLPPEEIIFGRSRRLFYRKQSARSAGNDVPILTQGEKEQERDARAAHSSRSPLCSVRW